MAMATSIGQSDLSKVQNAIQELRESLSDILTSDPQYCDQWFLLPWLRILCRKNVFNSADHRFNVQRAESAIRESIKWRKEGNFQADGPLDHELQKMFPYHLDAAKDGMPVLSVVVGGEVDHRGMISKFGRDRYLAHVYQFLAKAEQLAIAGCQSRSPHELAEATAFTGCIVMADVGNYSFHQTVGLAAIQSWIEICKNYRKYFFGGISFIYILNANKIFGPVLKVLKPFLEGPCLEIHMFHSNDAKWRNEMLTKQIDLSQIRQEFGGTKISE